ncbi:MAG: hypothetical protein GY767_14015 [Shimia sp.]|nr:hypothetical protein [Shimia sp.]
MNDNFDGTVRLVIRTVVMICVAVAWLYLKATGSDAADSVGEIILPIIGGYLGGESLLRLLSGKFN